MSAVYFPCQVCALDEIEVESIAWDWPPRQHAIFYCLVHMPADMARCIEWTDWLRWLFWNPLSRTPRAGR